MKSLVIFFCLVAFSSAWRSKNYYEPKPYVPPKIQEPYVPVKIEEPYVPPKLEHKPYIPPKFEEPYVPPKVEKPYVPPKLDVPTFGNGYQTRPFVRPGKYGSRRPFNSYNGRFQY